VRQIVQDRPAVHRSIVSIDDLIERYGPPVRRTVAAISSGLGHRAPAELRGPYKVGAFP
jgi:hypothetical protein